MMTMTQSNKAARGTKRVCQSCEVRFYDLMRAPIVCPACGAEYTPVAGPAATFGSKVPTGKTSWRQSRAEPRPLEPAPAERAAAGEEVDAEAVDGVAADEVAADDVADVSVEDDTVPVEQDGDDLDVDRLVERDVGDPKDV